MLVSIRRTHLTMGVAGILVFLGTGLYMDQYHGHLRGYDETVRMLFRSTHIYLLLAAVVNTVMGLYLRPSATQTRRALQIVGSIALLGGLPLFLVAFCTEPYLTALARPWSRIAIYLTFGGAIFHLLGTVPRRVRR